MVFGAPGSALVSYARPGDRHALELWIHDHPEDDEAVCRLASVLMKEHDYDKAIAYLEALAGRHTRNGVVSYGLGLAYFRKGELGRSMTSLEKAVALEPSRVKWRRALARVREAVDRCNAPLAEKGFARYEQGDIRGAASFADRILSNDPDDPRGLLLRGLVLDDLGVERGSEWEIEFWEGVTNAEALVKEAERLLEQIDERLEALAVSKDPPSPEGIKEFAKRARAYLHRITDKKSARDLLESINPRAPEIFKRAGELVEVSEEARIEARIAAHQAQRRTVKEVQRSVGQLAMKIAWAAEQDLAPECRKIQDRLTQEVGFDFSEEGIIGPLADALDTLHNTLAALKEQGEPPKIEETEPEALPEAVERLDKRVEGYQALVQLARDLEVLGCLYVLDLDRPEPAGQFHHHVDELVRVAGVDEHRLGADTGELPKDRALALHNRQAGHAPDVAQAKNGRAVGGDSHLVAEVRVLKRQRSIGLDGLAHPRHAGCVDDPQVRVGADRRAGAHLARTAAVGFHRHVGQAEHLDTLDRLDDGAHARHLLVALGEDKNVVDQPPVLRLGQADVAGPRPRPVDRHQQATHRLTLVRQPDTKPKHQVPPKPVLNRY